jgi:acetyltransferase-like isoleucine patch superfamily enzyme
MKVIFKFLYQFIWNIICIICQVFPDNLIGNKIRGRVYRFFLKGSGRNLQVSRSVHILYPRNLIVGDNVFIGFSCWVNAQGGVTLSDEVMLGPFTAISSSNHTRINGSYRFGEHSIKSIYVGRGVWIAAHCTILSGTKINEGVLVAAGCVVTGELIADALYVGSIANFKRKIDEEN